MSGDGLEIQDVEAVVLFAVSYLNIYQNFSI
jgi:hypothetical protein